MISSDSSRRSRWAGLALSVASFAVYALTLSRGAYPGRSAALVAETLGVFPRLAPPDPVWSGLAWLVTKLPVGTESWRLNLLSALCGALAVGLLYRLVRGVVLAAVEDRAENRKRAAVAAEAAGVGAALALAFCVPFWVVSTRAHTASLHVLMLTLSGWLLHRYVITRSFRTAVAFALLFGVGIVEFATFIILAPLAGLFLLYCLWRKEELRVSTVLRLVGAGSAGLLLYLLVAWIFYDSPGYHLREYRNYWHVIWIMWRDQYSLIVHSLPKRGWLLVVILTTVPWLTALSTAKRGLNAERDWTYYLLHLVIALLTLATLFNIKVAPWPMLGMQRLLVTPYLLTAMVFGYLVAYWMLLPFQVRLQREEAPAAWRPVLSAVFGVSLLASAAAAAFLNLRQADGRGAAVVNRYAREIVGSLEGREWLVTDGSLDWQIWVAAHEMRVPVEILSLAWERSDLLKKYTQTLFDSPALKNRARLGIFPLLQEWARSDDGFAESVALFGAPDLWAACGLSPVPNRLVFLAAKDPAAADAADLWAQHESLWRDMTWLTDAAVEADPLLEAQVKHMRRHAGMVANNLGVLLEDLGDDEHAVLAYRKARQIEPTNISALLNLRAMVVRGALTDESGEVQRSIEELLAGLGEKRLQIWSLSSHHGYVRAPEAFVNLGWYWAASGRPGMAVSGLKKALDLLPDAKKDGVKQALAGVYLMQDQDADSEALYYELLVENPENQRALLGMARIELMRGDAQKAGEYLAKAEKAGVPASLMDLEWGALEIFSKETDKAVERLKRVVSERPKLLRAWAMLTGIYIEQGNEPELAGAVEKLVGLHLEPNVVTAVAQAYLAVMHDDLAGARRFFEQAASLSPRNLRVLEWILKLDIIQTRQEDARAHVDAILRIDPDHAFANRILGTLQYAEGKHELAEDSLRRSVAKDRNPDAMNDLAWLLQESGLYEEAEELVRASLAANDRNHNAWDTLGVILMRTGRLEGAAEALNWAQTVAGDRISLLLHKAELLILRKKTDQARELLDSLALRQDELSASDREQFQTLKRKLQP